MLQAENQRETVQGNLSLEITSEIEGDDSNAEICKESITHEFILSCRRVTPQNYMADQKRLQISELQFDNFTTLSTFSCWKIRCKTRVSSCSGSPSEAILWIKDVEMVDLVDDLKSSPSFQGHTHFPDFLDARCEDCVEQKALKEDRFLRGRQIAYMIYDYFLVSGANDSVENYADLFTIGLRNDDSQEFDSKWDGIFIINDENPI